jgi:hypothetical protein
VGNKDVPGSRLPQGTATASFHRVGLVGNGLRLGASLGLPLSTHVMMEARPVIDMIRLDQVTIVDEGDDDVPGTGVTRRYALAIGVAYVF